MGTETNKDDRNNPEYLAQLLKDKKQIQALPNVFVHVEKLLDEGKSLRRIRFRSHSLYTLLNDTYAVNVNKLNI